MSIDYIVASLPSLRFDEPPALDWTRFAAQLPEGFELEIERAFGDLDTQIRNAIAEARGGEKYCRSAVGCSLFWKARVLAAMQEKDVMKRETALDRVRWDAAGELTDIASPLGKGALMTYALRLKIALKRAKISTQKGNEAFDRLTAETRI